MSVWHSHLHVDHLFRSSSHIPQKISLHLQRMPGHMHPPGFARLTNHGQFSFYSQIYCLKQFSFSGHLAEGGHSTGAVPDICGGRAGGRPPTSPFLAPLVSLILG